MKIVEKNIGDIFPYENNPRRNESAIEPVMKSIEQFGFKQPIVIDKDNVIIVGHTRWEAAQALGIKKVPCLVADDLSEEQVKAYRLADNKTAEFSSWDFAPLEEELEGISDIDMSEFGFDLTDINELELFGEAPEKEKEDQEHTIKCPCCGETIKLDDKYKVLE